MYVFDVCLSVWRVCLDVVGQGALPLVAVGQQALLIVKQLLARFSAVLEIGTLNDGIDGTGFLAKAAENALRHVNVVTSCAAGLVRACLLCSTSDVSAYGKRNCIPNGPKRQEKLTVSIVIACAGQIASHSLQAMHLRGKQCRRFDSQHIRKWYLRVMQFKKEHRHECMQPTHLSSPLG